LKIRFLGAHNSESATTGLMSILIDGRLVLDAGSMTSRLSFEEQQALKAILISHAHYDHVRDIPALAMNLLLRNAGCTVYSIPEVLASLAAHLMDGLIYPDFRQRPAADPTIRLVDLEPLRTVTIEGYHVLPVPVNHRVPGVGYQVTAPGGAVLFYTGDTGPGLESCWRKIKPQLLIYELTASERFREQMIKVGHMTPGLLRQELGVFKEIHGYLPRIVVSHTSPTVEAEIAAELPEVERALSTSITIAREGLEITL
jgi:ribonuclease BN (tRNA processing enzyme)